MNIIKACQVFLTASLLLPSIAFSEGLLSTVNYTLLYDAELSAANSEIKSNRENVSISRAALLPRLEGGWGRSYNKIKAENLPITKYWQNSWVVTLTQPVFDWVRWVELQQANIDSVKSDLEYASTWQALVLRSANAFFDLQIALQELSSTTDYLNAVSEQHTLTKKLQAGGEATIIDVQEAFSRMSEAQLRQRNAMQLLDSRRRELETLTGRKAPLPLPLNVNYAISSFNSKSLQQWVRQAEKHSYPVQLEHLVTLKTTKDIEKAQAQWLPVVNLSASHAPSGAAGGYSDPTTTSSVTLTISAPLFEGGAGRARIRQAIAADESARHNLLAAQRKAAAGAREWFQRLKWAQNRSIALKEIVRNNESSLEATRLGYKVGSRSNLDVLRAQESLFTSRVDQEKSNYEILSAFLALKAEAASLTLLDIQLLDTSVTPNANEN